MIPTLRLLDGPADPRLLDVVPAWSRAKICVAVDGATASGKTTWASALVAAYERSAEQPAVVISQDWFLRPCRDRPDLHARLTAGKIDESEYHRAMWDLGRFDDLLARLDRWRRSPDPMTLQLDGLFDRASGLASASARVALEAACLVVVEGAGVLMPERGCEPDAAVWVEASTIDLAIARRYERLRRREPDALLADVRNRYLTAERLHDLWIEKAGRARADWVLTCSDTGKAVLRHV
jgi:uridine kinase